jgi:RNA polymerase sigma-70 factor (ECF subfamily)
LPPQYRIVLVLRDMEGLTDDEVSEITGVRAGTVRVRLHRARLFVRRELMRVSGQRASKKASLSVQRTESLRPARCKEMLAELSDYLDEQLDDSLCQELEHHIEGCGPCQAFVVSLEATIDYCRKSGGECPPQRNASRFRKKLMQSYERMNAALRSKS